jgi:hypothetical protein
MHCYQCGRSIEDHTKAVAVLVIESHTGRLGSARLHADCCGQPNLVRYRQVIEWDGSTLGNLSAFKRLHGRLVALNSQNFGNSGSVSGSVPLILL